MAKSKEEILTKHTGWTRERTREANLSDVLDAMEAYHREKLRDELIRFQVFLSSGIQTGSIMGYSTTQVVDSYLKSQMK